MAELTVELDVKATNSAAYKHFIENLRHRLGVRFSHNHPILPPQENPPRRWFDAVLRTRSQAIRLRMKVDNLFYLDGYRAKNSSQRLEFGRSFNYQPIGFGNGIADVVDAQSEHLHQWSSLKVLPIGFGIST